MCINLAVATVIVLASLLVGWYTRRRHKKKETEIRAYKQDLRAEIQKTCEAAKKGDSNASLRLKALEDSITEQSVRLTGKPKPPTTVIKGGIQGL